MHDPVDQFEVAIERRAEAYRHAQVANDAVRAAHEQVRLATQQAVEAREALRRHVESLSAAKSGAA